MSKHTPAPWAIDGLEMRHENIVGYFVAAAGGGRICETFVNCLTNTPGVAEANARLISAAPEMLETLREVAIVLDDAYEHTYAKQVRDFIARVEGK